MLTLIQAALVSALNAEAGLPSEIVFLPEGEHHITPSVNGKAQRITVKVPADKGASIATKLQASLADRQKQNVRPWFDFEHKGGKASAIPTAFRYEAGKGIMASVEWTGAGKAAIDGRDFSYFSPAFLISQDGTPSSLPASGAIGALVNEPAFRSIPRIAASNQPTPSNSMNLILAHLGIDSAAEGAEKAALAKIQAAESELGTVKAKLTTLEAENKKLVDAAEAATKARHTALVEAAVAAGKIALKDDETKTQALDLLTANEALGNKFLDALPVKFAAFEKPLVTAGDEKGKGDAEARVQAAQSKARQELGQDADFQVVWARAAEIDPDAFN